MSERTAIERADEPRTVSSLAADLRDLGLEEGKTVLVHSSLSALGWVSGGAQAVVDAFLETLTESGTLVMPTHTGQYTDPAGWSNPPVPESWIEAIRGTIPPFRPAVTPTRGVGAIPECFRNYPGVARSRHPEVSFAAWGAAADAIVADHAFDHGLGERSPLARLYERNADVLLLGVGHDSNTSLHLGEYRADIPVKTTHHAAPIYEDGRRIRVEYDDIETDWRDFSDLGVDFERQVGTIEGTVGTADARLVEQSAIVDFAVEWFEANR